jgi:2-octaprenyl-6-methoxyphenol hydroxylase
MAEQRFDVVIAGGGLVGSALALALSDHGMSVAVIDPQPVEARAAPDFDGRAYAVAPGSANLLRALGVWEAVAPKAEAVQRIEVADRHAGAAMPAGVHFDPAEIGAPTLGWIVEDRWLRTALLEALAASDVHHLSPETVADVTRSGGLAEVHLEDGTQLEASLVVACDGRRSAIARAAGIKYLAWGYEQTGLVSAIEHTLPHEGLAHQGFFAGGPFAVLPLPGNRSSIVWSDTADRAEALRALSDEAYTLEMAARIGGRLGEVTLAGRRWVYPLGLQLAADYARPRLALVGDAAHGVHPIAGQGLNMGLRDVAALTEIAVHALRRGEDIGALPVLERYQRWRRFDATALALGMDGLNRMFSSKSGPLQMLRNAGLALVGTSGAARRFFMNEASGSAGDVPRLLDGQPI